MFREKQGLQFGFKSGTADSENWYDEMIAEPIH